MMNHIPSGMIEQPHSILQAERENEEQVFQPKTNKRTKNSMVKGHGNEDKAGETDRACKHLCQALKDESSWQWEP